MKKPKETDEQRRDRMRAMAAKSAAVRKQNKADRLGDMPPAEPKLAADPPKQTKAKAKAEANAIPQLEVWERRLVDPTNRGSREIHLKQKGFTLRIINTGEANRYQEAIYSQGWIPVRRSELMDEQQIAGMSESTDGLVRTGPGGVYLLCKMPTQVYDAIAKRKVEVSRGNRRSAQKQREMIMSRAADSNPRGAEVVASLKGEITELVERVDMDEADATPDLPTDGADKELA